MAPSARFTEDFAYEVLSVVGEIPEGTVATYVQIARLIGRDKNSRLVARFLLPLLTQRKSPRRGAHPETEPLRHRPM